MAKANSTNGSDSERDIYVEKESVRNFERPVYRSLVDNILREGDLLVVTELKRFGRNYGEILETGASIGVMGYAAGSAELPYLCAYDVFGSPIPVNFNKSLPLLKMKYRIDFTETE